MWTCRMRQSTKGNCVATDERKKRCECDDHRAKTLSKKPRARCNEHQRDGKVSSNDREWRLRDKAHTNNDRWSSSDNNKRLTSNFASAVDATGVSHIIATMTMTAVIATTAITTTASEVHEAPTNVMDLTDATDVEVVTNSQMANATQAAENAADAAMAMTPRRMRPIRHDAITSKGETSRDRGNTPSQEQWPCPPSEQRRSHIGGSTMHKKCNTNVIESDDDVDDEDVNNNALPAKLGKCSMGNDALTASPAFD
jgi:hypothetical protein